MSQKSKLQGLRAFQIVLIIVPTVAIILRFWSRSVASRGKCCKFWWDDWMASLALPFSIITNAIVLHLTYNGAGQHANSLSPTSRSNFAKALFVFFMTFDLAISLAKSSAIFLYTRLLAASSEKYRSILWTLQGFVLAWLTATLFAAIFKCVPVEKFWKPLTPGHCVNPQIVNITTATASAIIDLVILLVPLPVLWSLQAPLRRKVLISGVFISGYGVVVVSIGRMIVASGRNSKQLEDSTYQLGTMYWQGAEAPLSIFCICLPSIFSLARRGLKNGLSALFTSRNYDVRIGEKHGDVSSGDTSLHKGNHFIKFDDIALTTQTTRTDSHFETV